MMTETTWSIAGGKRDGEKLEPEAINALLEKPGVKILVKTPNNFTITLPSEKSDFLKFLEWINDKYRWFCFGLLVGYLIQKFNL
jgi:hypothetical protein